MNKRTRLLLLVLSLFLLAGGGYAAWWLVHGRYQIGRAHV